MSEYAADQLRQILIAGPSEGEDFFRLQVSGNGSSNHVNITPDQLKLIARILDASILDEKEKELLTQMISDYFDALDRNGVEEEQPDLYKDLTDRCDDIERKLGLA